MFTLLKVGSNGNQKEHHYKHHLWGAPALTHAHMRLTWIRGNKGFARLVVEIYTACRWSPHCLSTTGNLDTSNMSDGGPGRTCLATTPKQGGCLFVNNQKTPTLTNRSFFHKALFFLASFLSRRSTLKGNKDKP